MLKKVLESQLEKRGFRLTYVRPSATGLLWPDYAADRVDAKVLLLLTPPNSGSTALADFLGQSASIAGLAPKYEGQMVVRGMMGPERWSPDFYVDYRAVAGRWNRRIADLRAEAPGLEWIMEKSPPNLVRYRDLLGILPEVRVVVNIRDPYANLSSIAYRYWPQDLSAEKRAEMFREAVHAWRVRANYLRKACEEDGYPLLTYEQFCDDPLRAPRAFGLDEAAFRTDAAVSVKDYAPQEIRNMNDRQIAKLTDAERALITARLAPHEDLLGYFGYRLLD